MASDQKSIFSNTYKINIKLERAVVFPQPVRSAEIPANALIAGLAAAGVPLGPTGV